MKNNKILADSAFEFILCVPSFSAYTFDACDFGGNGSTYLAWHGDKPVSYTHLDVYKRQVSETAFAGRREIGV